MNPQVKDNIFESFSGKELLAKLRDILDKNIKHILIWYDILKILTFNYTEIRIVAEIGEIKWISISKIGKKAGKQHGIIHILRFISCSF